MFFVLRTPVLASDPGLMQCSIGPQCTALGQWISHSGALAPASNHVWSPWCPLHSHVEPHVNRKNPEGVDMV